MYKIIFYKDVHGNEPVNEYIESLDQQNTKDARIRKTKIRTYIKALALQGLPLTTNLCKHLDGDIWELRPNKHRVLFAGWYNGIFVLLHCFRKEGQKTPRREIEKAKKEFDAKSNLQAALIAAMIETRKEKNISQRDLEKLSGVKQPVIARIEKGENSPQVSTLLKLLAAMDKTLAIVPLKATAK